MTGTKKWKSGRPREDSYLVLLVAHVCHDALESILRGLWVVGTSVIKVDDALPLAEDDLGRELDVHGEAVAAGALPAGAAHPAGADLVEAAGWWSGRLVAGEEKDEGCNVLGLESLDHLLWHDGAGHSGAGVGRDGIDEDVVLGAFAGEGTGEAENTAFLEDISMWEIKMTERYLQRRRSWLGRSFRRYRRWRWC